MSWVLNLQIDPWIELNRKKISREDFYSWLWREYAPRGLEGVHEGTVLSEEAAELGLETDSWTVDSGEAPRERDWVGGRSDAASVELYWKTEKQARSGAKAFQEIRGVLVGSCQLVPDQDWDAEWKKSFKGVSLGDSWKIVPPWEKTASMDVRTLVVNPGAGFGTGTHETTQLCLVALSDLCGDAAAGCAGRKVLDFGSGSGILAIGAAKLGAEVDAVEIDPLAIDNAVENAKLNEVTDRIDFSQELGGRHSGGRIYDIVLANILRPVLLEFCRELVMRLKPGGALILSGLIESDVDSVAKAYAAELGSLPEVRSSGEWRALVWKKVVL